MQLLKLQGSSALVGGSGPSLALREQTEADLKTKTLASITLVSIAVALISVAIAYFF